MTEGLGKCLQISKLLYIKLQKIYKVSECHALLQAMGADRGKQPFAYKIQ